MSVLTPAIEPELFEKNDEVDSHCDLQPVPTFSPAPDVLEESFEFFGGASKFDFFDEKNEMLFSSFVHFFSADCTSLVAVEESMQIHAIRECAELHADHLLADASSISLAR